MFRMENQGHTLGNLVRGQLIRDPAVTFAAYRVPHPAHESLEIRVQTSSGTPRDAGLRAAEALADELGSFEQSFAAALSRASTTRSS